MIYICIIRINPEKNFSLSSKRQKTNNSMKKKILLTLLICWLMLLNLPAQKAAEENKTEGSQYPLKEQVLANDTTANALDTLAKVTTQSLFEKMKRDSIYQMVLTADFDKLIETRFVTDTPKEQATLSLKNDSTEWQIPVKLALRGRYRRKICDFPPIELDFPKEQLLEMGLHPKFDKLKLVTHCLDSPESNQTVLKEYWAYRMCNQLTPNSFKVHLVQITYIDINNPSKKEERLAFIIENNKELADRIGGKMVSKFGLSPEQLDTHSYYQTLIFNFMIGNVDWNVLAQRNLKYIQKDSNLLVVPYDFDQSAIVHAPYAKPHPDTGQKKLEDRFCLGHFPDINTLKIYLQRFSDLKDAFSCFEQCPYLLEKHKLRMKNYLNSFYKPLDKNKYLRKTFLKSN